ncbi:SWI/SNF chromatin-remodeling complex subunit, partial [Ascosphaera atra]
MDSAAHQAEAAPSANQAEQNNRPDNERGQATETSDKLATSGAPENQDQTQATTAPTPPEASTTSEQPSKPEPGNSSGKEKGDDTGDNGTENPEKTRSRSSSSKQDQDGNSTTTAEASQPTALAFRPRETAPDKILLEQYVNHEFAHDALMACSNPHESIMRQKREERDYYLSLQQARHMDPGSIFGHGYEGYGNVRTDLANHSPRLLYPQHRKRPGNRRSKEVRLSKEDLLTQADQIEDLVPI